MINNMQKILQDLIDESRYSRSLELSKAMSTDMFAKDFCTVGLLVPRRAGKTHYINEHADKSSLIIVPNYQMRYFYSRSEADCICIH